VSSLGFLGAADRRAAFGWATLVVAFLALVSGGCQPTEHVILLRVYAQEDVQSLRVILVSLDSPERHEQPERSIRRSADEIHADPIRVAITLGGPRYVMVHLVATTPEGDRLVATRCYAVSSVVQDDVLLVGPVGSLDLDGDRWAGDPSSLCREPGPDPRSSRACDADPFVCPAGRAADCNDGDPAIHPGAPTVCMNGVDEDCDGMDETCSDQDGDGWDACPMNPSGACDCNDNVPSINPVATDICNDGIDQDCSGVDACCDADRDGVEACANGLPDCDDANPDVLPGATEACDGVDNNCNAQVDELDECRGPDLDGDGVAACGREEPGAPCDCNDCDRGIAPNARERCGPRVDPGVPGNGLDEDCDGMVDEGCPADDLDGDGIEAARDCNDGDALVFPPSAGREPIDRCGDGMPSNCIPGEDTSCALDRDMDGFSEPPMCEDNGSITPGNRELCNGVDDDCDGVQDEVLSRTGGVGCINGMPLDFASAFTHCGGCRVECDPQTASRCLDGRCDCQWNSAGGACATSDTCCPGIGCRDLQNDATSCGVCGNACGQGETCVAGRCVCGATSADVGTDACPEPAGVSGLEANVCCGGTCRDVRTDGANCGECGLSCGSRSSCRDRGCACDAPAAGERYEDCNGDLRSVGNDGCEVNTLGSDVNRCGSCLTVCSGGQANWRCNAGTCEPMSCVGNFQNCDSVASNGCETDLTRPASCGACAPAGTCGAGETCDGSFRCTCGPSVGTARGGRVCTTGQACCASSGGCVDLMNDARNCGACGVTCGASETCSGGRCTCNTTRGSVGGGAACTGANSCCPSIGCVNLQTSTTSCGMCGRACATGETCSMGSCRNVCGNGVLTTGEVCDDGNTTNGDGCSSSCMPESGWTCTTGSPSLCTPVCGDGVRRGAETCDDGNATGGDGCSDTCRVETGFSCTTAMPNVCTPICGNGVRHGSETCDDGNTMANDGCSSSCQLETGWSCTTAMPNVCTPICGDSVRRGPETCDDGNMIPGDGCSATCRTETGWSCNTAMPNVCTPICGDAVLRGSETCDDRNTNPDDGCSPTCQIESGWTCSNTTLPSTCSTVCGDGLRRGSEACDDGFRDACGTCNATCSGMGTGSMCGDGVVCPETESCDDRNTNACGTCNATCSAPGTGATCPGGTGCSMDGDCMSNNCTGASSCSGG
jgi:cysteine-rich repeat protein